MESNRSIINYYYQLLVIVSTYLHVIYGQHTFVWFCLDTVSKYTVLYTVYWSHNSSIRRNFQHNIYYLCCIIWTCAQKYILKLFFILLKCCIFEALNLKISAGVWTGQKWSRWIEVWPWCRSVRASSCLLEKVLQLSAGLMSFPCVSENSCILCDIPRKRQSLSNSSNLTPLF